MARYILDLGEIAISPETTPVLNLTLAKDGVTNSYVLEYNEQDHVWFHLNGEQPDVVVGLYNGSCAVRVLAWTSEDVGDEYTINLSLPEAPTQSFSDAVHQVIDGEIVFEADLENEVPVSFDNYESNSALMYDIYINGKLCKRLQYSVLGGTPIYYTYEDELNVCISPSSQEIVLYANGGDTCHIKLVKKIRPESIMVFASKSGNAINVDAAFGDILTAAKEGYTFQLAIDGEVAGSTRYSEIGTLQASLDTSTYAASFDSTVTWRGEAITWTVNLTNMSISGAVGIINT